MATWDVFHTDRLEAERSLSAVDVRAALARGELREDDLARPSGTALPWTRLADLPELVAPEVALDGPPSIDQKTVVLPGPPPALATPGGPYLPADAPHRDEFAFDDSESLVAVPVADEDDPLAWPRPREEEPIDPQDEDEEAAEFTLARGSPNRVEELDLAAMVDVAFQMVLFFMVTATTVLYKSLEVPRTSPESPPGAVAQGQPRRTLDDMQNDYILVEIDPRGAIRVDHEPAPADGLVERLRAARQATGRTAMLLSAEFATPHRHAVLAFDAANEIGLRIAIAKPAGAAAQAPPPAAPKDAGAG